MTYQLGWKSWATGAAALAVVSGCGGTTPSATHSQSPPTTGSPVVAATSPSDFASANAANVVRRYYAVLDHVRQNPNAPISNLRQAETSLELNADNRLVTSERNKGDRQIGSAKLLNIKVQSVNLDNSDPAAGKVPTVVIDVCWDVSTVDVIGPNGKSVILPSRPDRGLTRYMVSDYNWASDPTHGWRVASGQDLKLGSCSAS